MKAIKQVLHWMADTAVFAADVIAGLWLSLTAEGEDIDE